MISSSWSSNQESRKSKSDPQNTMHVKIMYGLTDRGLKPDTGYNTFAPVDLTAPKVAAGKNDL